MRTTVELSDRTRARLLDLAARRGEKGFSALVEEAVVRFLDEEDERRRAVRGALDALGSLSDEDAVALEQSVTDLRARWR